MRNKAVIYLNNNKNYKQNDTSQTTATDTVDTLETHMLQGQIQDVLEQQKQDDEIQLKMTIRMERDPMHGDEGQRKAVINNKDPMHTNDNALKLMDNMVGEQEAFQELETHNYNNQQCRDNDKIDRKAKAKRVSNKWKERFLYGGKKQGNMDMELDLLQQMMNG